jgi:hypothetical protein
VLATESGFYLGANVGQSSFDVDEASYEEEFGSSAELDDTDTAWSLSAGYRIAPYFGFEASYVDMGELTFSSSRRFSSGPGSSIEITDQFSGGLTGFAFAAVGAVPIGRFEINARLGLLFAEVELQESGTYRNTFPGFPPMSSSYSESESTSTNETVYGLGAGYTFGDHFHVRADWIKVPDAGDEEETGEVDVSSLTLGFQYRF